MSLLQIYCVVGLSVPSTTFCVCKFLCVFHIVCRSENTGPVNLSPLAFEIMACLQGSRPHPSNGGPSDAEIKSA